MTQRTHITAAQVAASIVGVMEAGFDSGTKLDAAEVDRFVAEPYRIAEIVTGVAGWPAYSRSEGPMSLTALLRRCAGQIHFHEREIAKETDQGMSPAYHVYRDRNASLRNLRLCEAALLRMILEPEAEIGVNHRVIDEADPRFEGKVHAILDGVALVQWGWRGTFSLLRVSSLRRAYP